MKPILFCHTCGIKLNEFEKGKWNRLIDYWGGKLGKRRPRCRNCYAIYLKQAQERSTL